MGEMTGGIKGGMKILKSFVYKAFRGATGEIERFFDKTIKKRIINVSTSIKKSQKHSQ